MNKIEIIEHKKLIEYHFNEFLVCTRKEIIVKTDNLKNERFILSCSGNLFEAILGGYGVYCEEFRIDGNNIVSEVTLKVTTDSRFIVQVPFRYKKTKVQPYFMIPGFLYGSNNIATSDGPQPKFDYGGKIGWPASSKFYVRSDRSSNSGVIRIAENICSSIFVEHVVQGIEIEQNDKWSPAHLYTGLMLDSSSEENDLTGFQIGYENAPARYSWRKVEEVPRENERLLGFIENQKGKKLSIKTIFSFDTTEDNTNYGNVLKSYYMNFHETPLKVGSREEAIIDIGNSLIEYGYNQNDKVFILANDADGIKVGNIAWTGGMQAAYPLLKAGKYLNNQKFLETSKEFINHLCNTAYNFKSGLFNEEYRDGEWQVTGWWGTRQDCFDFGDKPLHSAYLNGQCTYYILKSYFLLGEENSHWIEKCKLVLDTVLKSQNPDGAFGVFFDPKNGEAVDYDGFQGCWFVPVLTILYKITNEQKYLNCAKNGLDHYYTWHLNGELYNTPMDTHRAIDQEGNLAFIAASRELHEVTNDEKFIKYGIAGLNWEFSWKFAYNTKFSNNPLRNLKWSTSGGSITSTHNPSIHQMGNLVAGDIYYFYNVTKDSYIKARLKDTCIWGLNAYNVYDGYLGFGKKGQATEQFTYTDGVVLPWPHPWDGGIWEANLPWAAACVLLSCADDIPDEFFEE